MSNDEVKKLPRPQTETAVYFFFPQADRCPFPQSLGFRGIMSTKEQDFEEEKEKDQFREGSLNLLLFS